MVAGALRRAEVERAAREKIRSLAEMGLNLGTVFFERMIASDFELMRIPPSSTFIPAEMDASGGSDGVVICTTAFGLARWTNVAKVGEKITSKHIEGRLFLKPQVVLNTQI